jgi:hypothetical protein
MVLGSEPNTALTVFALVEVMAVWADSLFLQPAITTRPIASRPNISFAFFIRNLLKNNFLILTDL